MLKFLRKYSKAMLIVFGVLLMVAFTAPQAIQQFGRMASNPAVARVGGKAIHAQDVEDAERRVSVLRQRVPDQFLPPLDPDARGLHWLLLEREARDAGLVGVAGDGALWIDDYAPLFARQQLYGELAQQWGEQFAGMLIDQQWNQLAPADRQSRIDRMAGFLRLPPQGVSEREYHEALSAARGISRLLNAYFAAAPLSDRRARHGASRDQRLADAEALWVSAGQVADIAGEPTAEQLREHYERFASTPMDGGEFGIGYTLPERLKIEYLKIDMVAVEAAVDPDPLEVRKLYQTRAREAEAAGQPVPPFEEARVGIERILRREIAADVMRTAQQAFVGAMGESTRALEDEGPYKRLPTDFDTTRPSLEAVAQKMVETIALTRFPRARGGSVALPSPTVVRPGRWLWADELQQLDGFGQAQISIGSNTVPVSQVLYAVRELRPELGVRLAIQRGLPVIDIPATDGSGSVYYYTVLDVREASAPDSIDEVREGMVEDWKALRAFERTRELADLTARAAANEGFTAAALRLFEALGSSAEAPASQLVRVTPNIVVDSQQNQPVEAINVQAFRDAAMGVYDRLDPMADIVALPREDRVFSVAIPGTLTLAVGIVNAVTPLTTEAFQARARDFDLNIRGREIQAYAIEANPFGLPAMRERLKVELIGRDGDAKADEPATPQTP